MFERCSCGGPGGGGGLIYVGEVSGRDGLMVHNR